MPSKVRRSSARGRPSLDGEGMSGRRTVHCSSVSAMLDMGEYPWDEVGVYHGREAEGEQRALPDKSFQLHQRSRLGSWTSWDAK